MPLPLKAKVSARDNWTDPESTAQKSVKNLRDVLGLEVHCEPQWPILVSELGNIWEDKGQLVVSVTSFLQTWFQVLIDLVEDETHQDWTDKLLTRIRESTSRVNLSVDSSTKWSEGKLGFVLHIPKSQVFQPVQFAGTFKEQLLECFEENQPSTSLPIHSTTGGEWADVGAEEPEEQAARQPQASKKTRVIDHLPDPSTMPRPGSLLQQAPYHLFVHASGNNRIEIECSHSQTLEVLPDYLKRWTRMNPNLTNKPPAVEIGLNHATCGFGLEYDRLVLFCENRYGGIFTISATMILNLVEGVFGYERVYGDSCSWHYRRDLPFKKL
ncbi:hypothetical protein F66182_7166 [Fusarium sp. NRRL 66182]|nr:hypothetical protein F66182_7166 [Fusarium sp. NRRL 66182]